MASGGNVLPNFLLTPQQQSLLLAALNSNKPDGSPANNTLSLSPSSAGPSSNQAISGISGIQESPFNTDLDYDFGDSSFDFSFDNGNGPKMIGDLPELSKSESPEIESPDKRSHPDDDDDDDDESGAKRRESEDKVAKKPGRKPLTTEPSTKRKAQNRAAQRAFRERKERHVKDLETKVEELQKASEAVNHENELLRAKVEKMTAELNGFKQKFSQVTNARPTTQGPTKPFGQPFISNLNDLNFQFEFPKFGLLPGPPTGSNTSEFRSASGSSLSYPLKRHSSDRLSPMEKPKDGPSPNNSSTYSQIALDTPAKDDLAVLSANLFSPSYNGSNATNASRGSFDSHFGINGATSSSSPTSSNSNAGGPSSSCGTSPEPFTQSPMGFKPLDTLTPIGEEQSTAHNSTQDLGHFANVDLNDFSWLPQNDFQFDPQLFGDYREPQANVLSNGGLDETFFNDAFDMDFTTPYNLPLTSPPAKKKDLIAQIDDAKNEDDVDKNGQLLTCNKIWEQLQECPKVQSGDFDLDGLCSELQKKAKCSGSGAVVEEREFKSVMQKYLGKTDKEMEECNSNLKVKKEKAASRSP